MNASDGTLKPKIVQTAFNHLDGLLLCNSFPPNIINTNDIW